jgi:hypothetical protein
MAVRVRVAMGSVVNLLRHQFIAGITFIL